VVWPEGSWPPSARGGLVWSGAGAQPVRG